MSRYIVADIWDLGVFAQITPSMIRACANDRGWIYDETDSSIFNTHVFYRDGGDVALRLNLTCEVLHKQRDLAALAEADCVSQLDILVDILGADALLKDPPARYRPAVDEVETDLSGVIQ